MTRLSSADRSACAAIRWRSFPRTSRIVPGNCPSLAKSSNSITEFDPLTGEKTGSFERIRVYANSHYVTPKPTMTQAIISIKKELRQRLDQLVNDGKLLEAQRLEQRTNFDIEMLEATGVCNGIENYSRYLTGRAPGEPPPTLFEFIPDNAIVFADEVSRFGAADRRHVQG